MKRNIFLTFFTCLIVLLTLSGCTVAEEFDVFHRDGKTYITSINVRTGAPNGDELGTRTFFDTRDDNYGIVYWEDGKTSFWPEDGEGTFGPDHLYFFNSNLDNYVYANSISDFFCAKQFTKEEDEKARDFDGHKWATFNLQLRTPPLQVWEKEGDPQYYGYYCPALEGNVPSESFTPSMQYHDQNGQGDAVLRDFLRKLDVLWLEYPSPDGASTSYHRFKWKDVENQDVYFAHIFSLVEVELRRNDPIISEWTNEGGSDDEEEEEEEEESPSNKVRNASNSISHGGENQYNSVKKNDDIIYLGNLSNLPFIGVELVGETGLTGQNNSGFLGTYYFDDDGRWKCKQTSRSVRCTRVDEDKNDLSFLSSGNKDKVLKYYFLVYSPYAIKTLGVGVISPRYESNGEVSTQMPFERYVYFNLEDNQIDKDGNVIAGSGFKFKPGEYYKISLDISLSDKFATGSNDADGKATFLDINWSTSGYHVMKPAEEMKSMNWGFKFKDSGEIDYWETYQ